MFHDLPLEIIYRILFVYDGRFIIRNGKIMTRFARDDPRYAMLLTIPKKVDLYSFEDYYSFRVYFSNENIYFYVSIDTKRVYVKFIVQKFCGGAAGAAASEDKQKVTYNSVIYFSDNSIVVYKDFSDIFLTKCTN